MKTDYFISSFWEVNTMDTIKNAREYEKELTRLYNRFNKKFWNNELPEVIITFRGVKGNSGHMSSNPVWISDSEEDKYELNINPYNSLTPERLAEIMLHEQCHLYNILHNINDTSNGGRYHNQNFKKTAEDHGLIAYLTEDGIHGWQHTELAPATKAYAKRLKIKPLEYIRIRSTGSGNNIRYGCPNCKDVFVYASSKKNVLCGNCFHPLVPIKGKKYKTKKNKTT